MSEVYHPTPENLGAPSPEKAPEQPEAPKAAEHHEHHDAKKALEKARHAAERHSVSAEKTKAAQPAEPKRKEVHISVSKDIKKMTYKRTLKHVRKQLSPLGRAGSSIIHQPVVEAVSEAAAKTVARPSGLLGGGLVAFIGTATYYLLVKHYQYTYNSTVFLILLLGGFVLGWVLEALLKLSHAKK